MKNKDYLLHLLAELSNYILEDNPSRMDISLHQGSDGLHLSVLDDNPRSEKDLEAIRAALNTTERPELAEYYGSMGGSDLLGHARLNLIGWQVKRADVERTPNGTRINLSLGSDQFDTTHFATFN